MAELVARVESWAGSPVAAHAWHRIDLRDGA